MGKGASIDSDTIKAPHKLENSPHKCRHVMNVFDEPFFLRIRLSIATLGIDMT